MIDNALLNKLYRTGKAGKFSRILQQEPVSYKPVVTVNDAQNNFIQRYFIRSVSDPDVVTEVDVKQFTQFKNNPRFITTEIKWKIIGKQKNEYLPNNVIVYGTIDINRQEVANADLTFGGLRKYIQDYTAYWVAEKV